MIVDGWLDWATRVPGPPDKRYTQPNIASGYVPHSAVGFYSGWEARLFSTERDPADPTRYSRYAAASVHGWIAYDGQVTQHYPFTASCWASGNAHANTHFIAFENEGGHDPVDEPLTPEQIAANVRIIKELSEWKGWIPRRPMDADGPTATLYEHNECVTLWGGDSTACPSNRIPWDIITAELRAPEEREALLLMAGGDDMAAFMKKADDPWVYLVSGNTKRKMHGERPELASALGIPDTVVTVSADVLDPIPEISAEEEPAPQG